MQPLHTTDILDRAAKRIRREPWFASGNWTVVVTRREWTALQLSKTNWFNDDGHGIHFETWRDEAELQSGITQFQAHVMHAGMMFPGTQKSAAALSRPVLARHRDLIKSWGYRVSAAGGMGLLSARIPFTPETLEDIVVAECRRFSALGDTIDEILACVLAGMRSPAAPRKAAAMSTATAHASILPGWDDARSPGARWTGIAAPKVTIALHPEAEGSLRVEVSGKAAKNHDAIVQCDGLTMEAGKHYRAAYEVKARVPRWMTGDIRQPDAPYNNVGEFKGRKMTTEWQTVSWEFTATRDEPNVEFRFTLGKVANTIWLRKVALRECD